MKNCIKSVLYWRTQVVCLVLAGFFVLSCSEESKNPKGNGKDSLAKGVSGDGPAVNEKDMSVIATDVCDCISNYENDLSSEAREQIIAAAKNGGLDTVWKTFNPQDMDVYLKEGKKTMDCIRGVESKHPLLKKGDIKATNAFSEAMEENCSEFAAALVRPR